MAQNSPDWWRLIQLTIDDIEFWELDSGRRATRSICQSKIIRVTGCEEWQLCNEDMVRKLVQNSTTFETKLYRMAAVLSPLMACTACGLDMQKLDKIMMTCFAYSNKEITPEIERYQHRTGTMH